MCWLLLLLSRVPWGWWLWWWWLLLCSRSPKEAVEVDRERDDDDDADDNDAPPPFGLPKLSNEESTTLAANPVDGTAVTAATVGMLLTPLLLLLLLARKVGTTAVVDGVSAAGESPKSKASSPAQSPICDAIDGSPPLSAAGSTSGDTVARYEDDGTCCAMFRSLSSSVASESARSARASMLSLRRFVSAATALAASLAWAAIAWALPRAARPRVVRTGRTGSLSLRRSVGSSILVGRISRLPRTPLGLMRVSSRAAKKLFFSAVVRFAGRRASEAARFLLLLPPE